MPHHVPGKGKGGCAYCDGPCDPDTMCPGRPPLTADAITQMLSPFDQTWKPVPCKPDCGGCKTWALVGGDKSTCPRCKAHTRSGICLNACHLSKASQERFARLLRGG